MTYTTEQIAKIHQKDTSLSDALKRDPLVNYYEGWFFVTLNTRDEAPLLSTCVGSPSVKDGEDGAPRCAYSELGEGVRKVIASIPEFHKSVEVIASEVMPEHLHMLLHLHPGGKEHLGKIISGFMSGCTHAYWDTLGIDWRKDHPTQGVNKEGGKGEKKSAAAHSKPDRDRDHTRSYRGPALFVRGYNDVEALTEEQVEIKRAYIRDQARKRLIQGDRHMCFMKHRHQHSRNWTVARVMDAIGADRFYHYNPDKRHEAQQRVLARLIDNAGLDYLGNLGIMASEHKVPLVCHRADAWQFERQKAAVMAAAREGAVIVSAFISPKEREIREQLMVELWPFVEIMDNGISERYKPIGKAFYAVAENRLVQIAPWSYRYQKDVAISREMCLVMNELARVISGRQDDWWKG